MPLSRLQAMTPPKTDPSSDERLSEEISERLRSIRASANPRIRQDEAAEAVGVNVRTMHQWETGKPPSALLVVRALCEFYGVSADYVLGLSNDPSGLPKGGIIVDQDIVEAVNEAESLEDIEELKEDEGLYPGHQVPQRPIVMTLREYQRLSEKLRTVVEGLPHKRRGRRRGGSIL